ncbi:McrB family protein [Methanosalsum natronophilum]|uniref:McrB family protein n=1 Tax=Methanosalsum natronophilum TaxID=768733 RepID=UPI002166DF6C|nr:AAA family ATPase [Methanosalsum natronophilum]MCS3924436.1 5-methylcytosine-specific restriction endonuclease McrBC GTP-binding regulatory subunit McrB [Methanosalsum natronophilum]
MTNVWLEKRIVKGRSDLKEKNLQLGNSLWSPQNDKRGANIYSSMLEVKVNDIVLHLTDNKHISGISKIAGLVDTNFKCPPESEWGDVDGYYVKLKDFIDLTAQNKAIPKEKILSLKNKKELLEILNQREEAIFYNKALNLNQGSYLTKVPVKLTNLINNAYKDQYKENIPYLGDIVHKDEDSSTIKRKTDLNNNILFKKKQLILYGPPGTGKTYNTKRKATEIIFSGKRQVNNLKQEDIDQQYNELKEDGRIEFITFHPSYSYEEFVEGITIDIDPSGKSTEQLNYKLKHGIFKQIAMKALGHSLGVENFNISLGELIAKYRTEMREITSDLNSNLEKQEEIKKWWKDKPRYVLIIDEINRGDISKIFGELVTLLEADKRLGMENELVAKLPYSQEDFAIPPNLYIIGTMNTADKSIALIDVALRRRFGFIEMSPDLEKVITNHIDHNSELISEDVIEGLKNSITALEIINNRISSDPSVGRDKQIGHSFLFKVFNQADLILVWKNEILPLLEEYYYGQYSRINELLFKKMDDSYWLSQKEGIKDFQDYEDLTMFLDEVINNG